MPQGKYSLSQIDQPTTGKYNLDQISEVAKPATKPTPAPVAEDKLFNILSNLQGYIRGGASMASGAAAGIATGNPIVGSGVMATVDELLRKFGGEGTGSITSQIGGEKYPILKNPVASAIAGTAEAELGGRAIGLAARPIRGIARGIGEATGISSAINPALKRLTGTASQYFQSSPLGLIEDLFSKSGKKEALARSGAAISKEAEQVASQLAGRTVKGETAKEVLSLEAQKEVKTNLALSVVESNKNAAKAVEIAKFNVNAQGVEGPIDYTDTLNKLKELEKKIVGTRSNAIPDKSNPMLQKIDEIFTATQAQFDASGKVTSHIPTSFNDAWSDKQAFSSLAQYGDPLAIKLSNSQLKDASKIVDNDITKSVGSWQQGGFDAKQYWEKAKQLVNTRHEIFNPIKEKGVALKDLLIEANDASPTLDAISESPKRLSRFLMGGNQNLVTQTGTIAERSIYAPTNARKAMQSYKFMSLIDNAKDKVTGTYDQNLLRSKWAEYANSTQGRLLYNKQQREGLTQIFDNFAKVSTDLGHGGLSNYLTLRTAQAGASAAGAIVAGTLLGAPIAGARIAGGVLTIGTVLTLRQLGKIATNEKAAPVVAAMFRGGPLNMSHQMANRILTQALKGETVTYLKKDGTEEQSKIEPN